MSDKKQNRKIFLFLGAVLDTKRYDTHGDGNAGVAFGEYLDKQRGKWDIWNSKFCEISQQWNKTR